MPSALVRKTMSRNFIVRVLGAALRMLSVLALPLAYQVPASAGNDFVWSPVTEFMEGGRLVPLAVSTPTCNISYIVYGSRSVEGGVDELVIRSSQTAGRVWSVPRRIGASGVGYSSCSIGSSGTAAVYVLGGAAPGGAHAGLLFWKSTDSGNSWSSAVRDVSYGRANGCCGSQLVCDDGGKILVAFNDLELRLLVNVSQDGGETWLATPIEIAGPPAENRLWEVCSAGGGFASIVYTVQNSSEVDGVFVTTSTDGGHSWSPPTRMDEGADLSYGANLVADGMGRVACSWADESHRTAVRFGDEYGAVFGPVVSLESIRTFGVGKVSIDCLGVGKVALWGFPSGAPSGVYLAEYSPGDSSLHSERRVSDDVELGTAEILDISSAADGSCVIVWSDWRTSYGDYWANVSTNGVDWPADDVLINELLPKSQATRSVDVDINVAGQVVVAWGDCIGQCVPRVYVRPASLGVAMSVVAEPPILPAVGGSVVMECVLSNVTSSMLESISVWMSATRPDGNETPVLIGPISIARLSPGRTLRKRREFMFPSRLSTGTWKLNLWVGEPLNDVASACIRKKD